MHAPPFFIMATPRSGTTLLERILNSHSEVFIPPETVFFYKLELFLGRYPVFDTDSCRRFLESYLASRAAGLLNLPDHAADILMKEAHSYADVFINLLELVSAEKTTGFFGEKTPHHLKNIDTIRKIFPDSKFIFVVRDGRAVVKSHVRHPNWSNNLIVAARYWRDDARIIDAHARDSNVLVVRYEDLLVTPEDEIRKICEFTDIDFQAQMLENNAGVDKRFESYYQQSWMSKSTSGIDADRAESWRDEYSACELSLVEALIGDELELFNYQRDGGGLCHFYNSAQYLDYYIYRVSRFLMRNTNRT